MTGKFFRLFIVLLIMLVAFYFAFNMVMTALIHNKKEVVVPNIVGKSLYDAIEELSKGGFGFKKDDEEFNQGVPAGTILRQNPSAGMSVREGKLVRVTISQGGEIIHVPNLIGQTLRSADIALRYSSLVMGEVSKKYSIVAEKGIVLSQDIAAESAVDKDSVVNIVVSDGLPPEGIVLMPDFVNKSLEEAKIWAIQRHITINVINEEVSGTEIDIVIRQFPEADTDITNTKIINLYIAANTVNLE